MNTDAIRTKLKEQRQSLGLSAEELGKLVGVAKTTIYRYENGDINKMPMQVLYKISSILKINPMFLAGMSEDSYFGLKKDEAQTVIDNLQDIFSELNDENRQKVLLFAEERLKKQNSTQETVIPFSPRTKQQGTEITIYGAVSAGTGEMLGDGVTTKRCYFGKIPHHDYALTVNGDSMKPMFEDGQIIFVENVEDDMEFLDGQIVIAILNGESYIKKLRIMKNCAQLISLNAKYDPIEVSADDDFKIKGKVIL